MNTVNSMSSWSARLAPIILILGILYLSGAYPIIALPGGVTLLIYGLVLRRKMADGPWRAAGSAAITAGALILILVVLAIVIFFPASAVLE